MVLRLNRSTTFQGRSFLPISQTGSRAQRRKWPGPAAPGAELESRGRARSSGLSTARRGGGCSPFFVSLSLIMKEPIFVSGSCSSSSALSLPSPSNSQLRGKKADFSILSTPSPERQEGCGN